MPSQFDQILLQAYKDACLAYGDLMKDGGAVTKSAFGRSYTRENSAALRTEIMAQEKILEGRGLLPMNLRSSKVGVSQMQVVNPSGYMR